jgi:hypothetical protein
MLSFKSYLKEAEDPCWDGYQQVGMKSKNGKRVPNCVPEEVIKESGGEVVFKSGEDHIEKYGEHSFAVYRGGQKATYYKSLDDAKQALKENFQDGRNPQDKGDVARHGLKGKSAAQLRSIRSSDDASPRKKQLAHWMLNFHHNKKK